MNMLKTLIFIIISLQILSSQSAEQLPSCKPKTADNQLKDSLIILTTSQSTDVDFKNCNHYLWKLLACEIPISNNIQTFNLDYTADEWNDTTTNFYDSESLIQNFASPAIKTQGLKPLCQRYEEAITKFRSMDAVKNHPNVVFISSFSTNDFCPSAKSSNTRFQQVVFTPTSKKKTCYYLTVDEGSFNPTDQNPPQKLSDAAKHIIHPIFGNVVEEADGQCKKGPKLDWLTASIVVDTMFIFAVLILIIVKICSSKEKKKYRELEEDNEDLFVDGDAEKGLKKRDEKEEKKKRANQYPKFVGEEKKAKKEDKKKDKKKGKKKDEKGKKKKDKKKNKKRRNDDSTELSSMITEQ